MVELIWVPSLRTLCLLRKGQANVEAVDERQQLESLAREEKTLARTLASVQARYDEASAKKAKLQEDSTTNGEKKTEVCSLRF